MLQKILAGGQTGTDRAALDAAIRCGIDYGGWCPPDGSAEDGLIDLKYGLLPTPYERSERYPSTPRSMRTEWNVRDAEALLAVIIVDSKDVGTSIAVESAIALQRPVLKINLTELPEVEVVRNWLQANHIDVLNISGPSEIQSPGIYSLLYPYFMKLFRNL